YVAMTRAKEKLVMIGNVSEVEKEVEKWQEALDHNSWTLPLQLRKKAKNFLDWVGPSLIRHQGNDVLREGMMGRITFQEAHDDPSNWKVHMIAASELLNLEAATTKVKEDWQQSIVHWNPSGLANPEDYTEV